MDWKHTPSTRTRRPSEIIDINLLLKVLESADTPRTLVMTPADAVGRSMANHSRGSL